MTFLKYLLVSIGLGCGAAGVTFFLTRTCGSKKMGNASQRITVDAINHAGTCAMGNMTVRNDVVVMGTSHLSKLDINGECRLTGMTSLEDTTIEEKLEVSGMSTLKKVVCKKDATFIGYVTATESSFKNLSITTQKGLLRNSKIDSLYIRYNGGDEEQHVTTLELNNSIIEGNVVVEDKQHLELIMKGNSVIKGQITGSHTIKK